MYDFLVVGAGISGATFARLAAEDGKSVLVVDKSKSYGGLCETYNDAETDIIVHKHGPHIFHTSDLRAWNFVNRFCNMIPFTNSPLAKTSEGLFNLPINMNTLNKLFGVTDPKEAELLMEGIVSNYEEEPKNFEQACKSKVGKKIFELFFKSYTEKQWHTSCENVPADVFSSRQPVRFTYNNNYFNDMYQGIPEDGYSDMIRMMLNHENITVSLDTEFSIKQNIFNAIARKIVYTGALDELFGYCEGYIRFNSLSFDTKVLDTSNFQGNAVINYCTSDVPYTRVTEHKFFNIYNDGFKSDKTVISFETPEVYRSGENIPMYPVAAGKETHDKYLKYLGDNIIPLGRLAEFKYLNMDQAIINAMEVYHKCTEASSDDSHIRDNFDDWFEQIFKD